MYFLIGLGLGVTDTDRQCRKCEHRQSDHPNSFLCQVEDCRCPGYFGARIE